MEGGEENPAVSSTFSELAEQFLEHGRTKRPAAGAATGRSCRNHVARADLVPFGIVGFPWVFVAGLAT
jgi:hypothetical protein